jgi:hypothetical protein
MPAPPQILFRIRLLLTGVIIGLVVSGVTAFPLTAEVAFLVRLTSPTSAVGQWLRTVHEGLAYADAHYPFLAYGTDWLAFAHLAIAAAFIGPLRDPVKNQWTLQWGILCCLGVLPLALIAGPLRSIPPFHQLIDCSFGLIALPPLYLCHRWTCQLKSLQPDQPKTEADVTYAKC